MRRLLNGRTKLCTGVSHRQAEAMYLAAKRSQFASRSEACRRASPALGIHCNYMILILLLVVSLIQSKSAARLDNAKIAMIAFLFAIGSLNLRYGEIKL
jgi:hypothetical protein